MIKVLFICHGNICRSTMAQSVMQYLVNRQGISAAFQIDSANLRNMRRIVGDDPEKKMFLVLEFAGEKGDIADPWYTGNFEDTYRDVCRGCEGLLVYFRLSKKLSAPPSPR